MSRVQRVRDVLIGLLSLVFAVAMVVVPPDVACDFIAGVLCITLTLAGLGRIVYYFTMARHMVGGRAILYLGVLLLDVGVLTGGLTAAPQNYLLFYLLVGHLFSGAVDVMQAMNEKSLDSSAWKWTLAQGIANILLAVACIAYRNSLGTMVYLYCAGMVYSACVRIATAFRRTAIVYIP